MKAKEIRQFVFFRNKVKSRAQDQFDLLTLTNDTLLSKSTKIRLISTNITLVLRCLRPHCPNFQQLEQLLVTNKNNDSTARVSFKKRNFLVIYVALE